MILMKLANTYVGWWSALENFLRHSKAKALFTKTLFLISFRGFQWTLPLKGVWKLKIRHHLTFGSVKYEPSVVGCSRLFLWIAMIPRKLSNTFVEWWSALENFFETLKGKCLVHQNTLFELLWMHLMDFVFERGMKTEKSPSSYVWIYKVRTKCRGMFPFVSADSYDPKKAFEYICWVVECIRNVFWDTQRQRPCSPKQSFWTLLVFKGKIHWKPQKEFKKSVLVNKAFAFGCLEKIF